MEHAREGRSTGDWGLRNSTNATLDRRTEAAILASEIANLEDLTGYFQTPGYTLRLAYPFFKPQMVHQPLIRRDPPGIYPVEVKPLEPNAESAAWKRLAEKSEAEVPGDSHPADPVDPKQTRVPETSQETGDTYPAAGAQ